MPTISINNETEQMVEEIQDSLLVAPTKKKTVEKAVKQFHEKVMEENSDNEQDSDDKQAANEEH